MRPGLGLLATAAGGALAGLFVWTLVPGLSRGEAVIAILALVGAVRCWCFARENGW